MRQPLATPLLFICATVIATPGIAGTYQEEQSVSLKGEYLSRQQLVTAAAQNNRELRQAGIVLLLAHSRVASSNGPFDFVLESGSTLTQNLTPNPFQPDQLRRRTTAEAHVQVSKILRTGTQLRLRLAEAYTEYPLYSTRMFPSEIQLTVPEDTIISGQPEITFPVRISSNEPAQPRYAEIWSTNTDFSIVQPLLRGASADAIDAPLKTARSARRRAWAQKRQTATKIIANIIRLAAQLALARSDHTLRLAARDLAIDELELTQAKIAAGQLPEISELQIRQTIAEREEAGLQAERRIRDLDAELKRALGFPIAPGGDPLNPASPHLLGQGLPAKDVLSRALQQSPEIQAAKASVAEAKAALAAANNGLLPRLDASVGLGLIAQDEDSLEVWERMFAVDDGFNWHAGVSFIMPIENHEARSRAEESRLNFERTQLALEITRDQLRVEVTKADHELAAAEKRIKVAQTARDLAARSVEGEAERYHLGLTTAHDLLDAQERLRRAELALKSAQHDLVMAELRLLELSGDLLEQLGVDL